LISSRVYFFHVGGQIDDFNFKVLLCYSVNLTVLTEFYIFLSFNTLIAFEESYFVHLYQDVHNYPHHHIISLCVLIRLARDFVYNHQEEAQFNGVVYQNDKDELCEI